VRLRHFLDVDACRVMEFGAATTHKRCSYTGALRRLLCIGLQVDMFSLCMLFTSVPGIPAGTPINGPLVHLVSPP
jgi:hypothetical protein